MAKATRGDVRQVTNNHALNGHKLNGHALVGKPLVDHLRALKRDLVAMHSQNLARLDFLIAQAGK